jgi:hypothetical protein
VKQLLEAALIEALDRSRADLLCPDTQDTRNTHTHRVRKEGEKKKREGERYVRKVIIEKGK